MASARRQSNPPLKDQILDGPGRFGFFQAVRLLEWIARPAAPVGEDTHGAKEAVRFHASAATSFPVDEVTAIRPVPHVGPAAGVSAAFQMVVTFMGLIGPKGVLPAYYTRLVQRRGRAKDRTLRDFFDLFNHRAISLFYRAWSKYRFPIAFEREQGRPQGGRDQFTESLNSLVGFGTVGQLSRVADDDRALVYYAGLFAHFPRCVVAMEAMLADRFGLKVKAEQFIGQWLALEPADRTRLPGRGDPVAERHNRLGQDAILGERVWDVSSKFRVRLEALSVEQFWRFLPGQRGGSLAALGQLVRIYAGPDLDFDVQLVLRRNEMAWVELGCEEGQMPKLGWNIWLRSSPLDNETDDAIFESELERRAVET